MKRKIIFLLCLNLLNLNDEVEDEIRLNLFISKNENSIIDE